MSFAIIGLFGTAGAAESAGPVEMPDDYYREPEGLSFDEELIQTKQEAGWHWKEFRYTSYVMDGEPTRVHAVYAVPDTAGKRRKVPAIIMTHGVFGAALNNDWRYTLALNSAVKAGYAVLFFDWYPEFAHSAKPDAPKTFTTFGKLDYYGPDAWTRRGRDFKESLHFQAMMAGRRGVSWLCAQPEVDTTRIGATGASYGGIFSSLLAAIEPRIKAVAPTVYTAGFGLKETGYNMLPSGWTQREADAWVNRFDSKVLLAKRKIPVLYTVGANDPTFLVTKAMDTFGAMNEPKRLLIGPNQGHDYWDIPQTIFFFDEALKNGRPRERQSDLELHRDGRNAVGAIRIKGPAPAKVEVFFAPQFEIDPDESAATVNADVWKWDFVQAVPDAKGVYSAPYPLPSMRPLHTGDKLYDWTGAELVTPVAVSSFPAASDALSQGLIQAFARVTDKAGVMETTPLARPLAFTDEATAAATESPLKPDSLPSLVSAVRTGSNTASVAIRTGTPAGEARATLPVPVLQPAVGAGGYILWNWRKQLPSTGTKTGETTTPTMQVFAPFDVPLPTDAFTPQVNWAYNSWGGYLSFAVNGESDLLTVGRGWHGAVPVGNGGNQEIPILVADDSEHLVTVVLAANSYNACNVRVSLTGADGRAAIVRFRHTDKTDAVLQFRFKGNARLRVQTTSQPATPYNTLVGPSALFLD